MVAAWGFTVDDALITARVAHQLAVGHGYRFNPDGPLADAVTPLGFVFLLVPFASTGPLAALSAAKWIGALSNLLAAAYVGAELSRRGSRARMLGTALLLSTVPLAAWSVSGMETGIVALFATLGLASGARGPLLLGVAAALRPELVVYSVVYSSGHALFSGGPELQRLRRAACAALLAALPFALVGVLRTSLFGAPYPPSWLAKAPVFGLGLRYALGGAVLCGPFFFLLGSRLRATNARVRAIALAALLHLLAVAFAGGDWMPFHRLLVPILPAVILAAAELSELQGRWLLAVRGALHTCVTAILVIYLLPSARLVTRQREALIAAARPVLRNTRAVAAVDVGWISAATSAAIVDLAGVTDRRVAELPGGHTSKRLPDGLLEARNVDALVVLARSPKLEHWPELDFVYASEARLPHLAGAAAFRPVAIVPLAGTEQAYVLLLKRDTLDKAHAD